MDQEGLKSKFARANKALVAMGTRLTELGPRVGELEHILYSTIITRSKKRAILSLLQALKKQQSVIAAETKRLEQLLTDFREAFYVE